MLKEYILCAAIWYKQMSPVDKISPHSNPSNINEGIVVIGKSHAHCIGILGYLTGKRSVTVEVGEYEQGFLTSKNRFVDRTEAFIIAKENKQIGLATCHNSKLFSEDLY